MELPCPVEEISVDVADVDSMVDCDVDLLVVSDVDLMVDCDVDLIVDSSVDLVDFPTSGVVGNKVNG